ncbi:MAG: hypothetical protein ACOX3G_02005 [Armatimonadota bacterium]|jgi:hypothetical protein
MSKRKCENPKEAISKGCHFERSEKSAGDGHSDRGNQACVSEIRRSLSIEITTQ